MKWKIEIEIENKEQLTKVYNILINTFDYSKHINKPLQHVYLDKPKTKLTIIEE